MKKILSLILLSAISGTSGYAADQGENVTESRAVFARITNNMTQVSADLDYLASHVGELNADKLAKTYELYSALSKCGNWRTENEDYEATQKKLSSFRAGRIDKILRRIFDGAVNGDIEDFSDGLDDFLEDLDIDASKRDTLWNTFKQRWNSQTEKEKIVFCQTAWEHQPEYDTYVEPNEYIQDDERIANEFFERPLECFKRAYGAMFSFSPFQRGMIGKGYSDWFARGDIGIRATFAGWYEWLTGKRDEKPVDVERWVKDGKIEAKNNKEWNNQLRFLRKSENSMYNGRTRAIKRKIPSTSPTRKKAPSSKAGNSKPK